MNPTRGRALSVATLCLAALLVAAGLAQADAGHLDRSFGGDGLVTVPGTSGDAQGVTTDSRGRVVAVGFCPASACMVRYTQKGRLDRSFSRDGTVRAKGLEAWDVAMDSRRIVMAGDSLQTAPPSFTVARYRPDGHRDRSFARDGRATTRMKGSYAALRTVAVDSKGRIVLAGYVVSGGAGRLALVRYLPNGRLDHSFGNGGKVIRAFGSFSDGSIAVDSKNRIVAGASDPAHHFELMRFRAGGKLDKSFGSDGMVTSSVMGTATTVMVDHHGRIVAAGRAFNPTTNVVAFALARFHPSGRPDRAFGAKGVVVTEFDDGAAYLHDGAIGPGGRIVVAGRHDGRFTLARYRPSGALDRSFADDGIVSRPAGSADALAIDHAGRPVAAGFHHNNFAVARYTGG